MTGAEQMCHVSEPAFSVLTAFVHYSRLTVWVQSLIHSEMLCQGHSCHIAGLETVITECSAGLWSSAQSVLKLKALTQIPDGEGFSSSHSLFRTKAHLALRYMRQFHSNVHFHHFLLALCLRFCWYKIPIVDECAFWSLTDEGLPTSL